MLLLHYHSSAINGKNNCLAEPKNGAAKGFKKLETAPKDIDMDPSGHNHVLIQRYEAASCAAGILDIDLDA
ncbi:hypothetical protein [uncultured Selenomonas sp.]|uniref:hypothetical protein n=1 Tax=uncultured Selenomonas sp. TaxID=159275 RepID=UPI0028EB1212|nr:hypothetical protein [uncultured Selenomonas sp.]